MRTLGLIGGTGLDEWGASGQEISADTPYGAPSGPIQVYNFEHVRLLFLPRHGRDHQIAPHAVNYRANIWALKQAGATEIIAVNAVGGIRPGLDPGALVLPDQVIDYTWGRQHSYSGGSGSALQHIDFTSPFSSSLMAELISVAGIASIPLIEGGCVGVTQGPRLETAAEIRRLERDGCDVVGMTTMPEASLAAELGLLYASISMVVNPAAGKGASVIDIDEVERCAAAASEQVRRLLQTMLNGPVQASSDTT
ncbi:MAG: S-methyl-5'-thioinosine phosphorylase [Xanthomonadales bacterium]|nr:S-methyl-5'-thioinosine phosphorylase [Xanthomonadales bacterium]